MYIHSNRVSTDRQEKLCCSTGAASPPCAGSRAAAAGIDGTGSALDSGMARFAHRIGRTNSTKDHKQGEGSNKEFHHGAFQWFLFSSVDIADNFYRLYVEMIKKRLCATFARTTFINKRIGRSETAKSRWK